MASSPMRKRREQKDNLVDKSEALVCISMGLESKPAFLKWLLLYWTTRGSHPFQLHCSIDEFQVVLVVAFGLLFYVFVSDFGVSRFDHDSKTRLAINLLFFLFPLFCRFRSAFHFLCSGTFILRIGERIQYILLSILE